MTGFGWTRLAYLLVVLSVLGVLVQLGSPSADPRPLAAEPPETGETAGDPPAAAERPRVSESASSRASAPRENSGPPAFARHLKRATTGGLAAAPDAGKAVFHRPPPGSPADAEGAPGPRTVCGDLGRAPSGQRLVFPLPMQNANSYDDTWGAPRPQGGHEGTDLMVPTGTPEYAVTDGTLVPVAGSNGNGWNSLGGYAVMLRAAYSVGPVREGDLFYYAHLEEESALPIGSTVRAGQVVGYAGDTGQGPEVTRGLFPPHLHFGWYDAGGGRSYLPSGAMNPFPLLEWVRSGGGVLGGGSDARYCEVPRSGAPIPSTGANRWPDSPGNDGARPDLDTGERDPAPSPVVAGNGPGARERPDARPEPRNREPDKDSREGSGKTPDRDPRAPKPPPPDRAPDEDPAKPEPRDEPASPRPPAEQDPEEDPRAPIPSPGNEPPPGGGNPGGGQGNEEPGEHEDRPEPETPAQNPEQEEPGKGDDPEGPREEPEEDPAPPEGEEASDEDEDPESTVPEAGDSEDAGPAPEETTPE